MITVAAIAYTDVKDQPALLAEYVAECANPVLGTPQPQWETYETMQASGIAQAFSVYLDEEPVGFSSLIAAVSPLYGVMVATVDALFVTQKHRDTLAAARLLAAMEGTARARGCKAIFYSSPAGSDMEAVLGKRYTRTNSAYCKPLCDVTADAGGCQ